MPSKFPEAFSRGGRPRYEHKFVVPIDRAEALLRALADELRPDPHDPEGRGYPVSSLYFDTADDRCYFEKIDGVDPRFKLRLRYYGDVDAAAPGRAGFLEAKYRSGQRVAKLRCAVSLEEMRAQADTGLLQMPTTDPSDAADALHERVTEDAFMPRVGVRYFRRALIGRRDPNVRVTVDTSLRALGTTAVLRSSEEEGRLMLPPPLCVLELKFCWAMPLWMLDASSALGLLARRYSKYAAAFEATHREVALREVRLAPQLG